MILSKTLLIRSSPHIGGGQSVDQLMFHVVLALLPAASFAVYQFGLAAVSVLSTALFSCVVTEDVFCRMSGRRSTVRDFSAVVTGLLYGMSLPPSLPLWMVCVGGVCAIVVGKALFGGLGCNPFNPALVGRALLQAAYPAAMTTWPAMPTSRFLSLPSSSLAWPFTKPHYDAISGATPLAKWKFENLASETGDMWLGTINGSTGETSAVLIVIGGFYLAARGMLNWRIPVSILLTVVVLSAILHQLGPDRFAEPLFMLSSGGLMLGAVFMATDPVGSPMTHQGCLIYGVLIGGLVITIRTWGGMPEGVMYSILLANAVTPHIDHWIQPRAYGTSSQEKIRG